MTDSTLPTGAVLDKPMVHALLYCGVQEGLLDDNPAIGDYFVRQLMNTPPAKELVANALEHLVLSGRIYAPFWLPSDWRGELLERELVLPSDPGPEDELVEVPWLPPDLVLAMLKDRGMAWTHGELLAHYNTFMAAHHAWQNAGAKSLEGLEFRNVLRKVMPIEPDEYSPEQLSTWNALNDACCALGPVQGCVADYRRVLTTSLQNSALSALPISPTINSSAELPLVKTALERTSLLKIACKGLRRVPIGNTLRETIALATSSEAEGLRQKLNQWTKAIRGNDINPAAVVLGEIERARRSLKTAKSMARAGQYSTVLGVPASVAGLFVAGPLAGILGLSISVIGGVALAGQKLLERMNRWAMFGQE